MSNIQERKISWQEKLEVEILQEIGDYGLTGGECIQIETWIENNVALIASKELSDAKAEIEKKGKEIDALKRHIAEIVYISEQPGGYHP